MCTHNHETQLVQVARLLLSGKYITQEIAINNFRCFRLSSVIERLRHKRHLPISTYNPCTALEHGVITKAEYNTMHCDELGIYHISTFDRSRLLSDESIRKEYGIR